MNADASVAPVAERFVVEALVIVAMPVVLVFANDAPFAERFVVDALVLVRVAMKPLVKVRPVPDTCEVEALPKVV